MKNHTSEKYAYFLRMFYSEFDFFSKCNWGLYSLFIWRTTKKVLTLNINRSKNRDSDDKMTFAFISKW